MSRLVLPALIAFAFAADNPMQTEYKADAVFAVTVESRFAMERTNLSVEQDGEPVEASSAGERSSTQTRELVMRDTILEVQDGKPTRIQREFETLSSHSIRASDGDEQESDLECPLNGVVLELKEEGGEVQAEVIEGSAPDDDALLEGHGLTLALDALYPEEETAVGEAWTIDGESLLRALAMDQEKALFPTPPRQEGGERTGGGGRNRGRGRGAAEGAARYFSAATWELEGVLEAETEERDGTEYYVIQIKGEASGEVPERGRRRQDRQNGLWKPNSAVSVAIENSFSIELEGTLLLSVEGRHPAHFNLEASLNTSSTREMTRRDPPMIIHTENAGTLEYAVTIELVQEEDEE